MFWIVKKRNNMANVKIRNEVELMAYFDGLVGEIDGLGHVVYVDAGDDIDEKVREFLLNTNLGGECVLFVWLGEGDMELRSGLSEFMMQGLMCMGAEAEDKKASTLLAVRTRTRECLLNVFGRVMVDEEESRLSDFDNRWEMKHEAKFLPTSDLAMTNIYGWTVGFEVMVECGEVVFNGVAEYLGE